MYVIQREANEYGARTPLFLWDKPTLPKDFVFCPDAFYDVFYSTSPAGFVNITVEECIVTAMTVNWDAYNKYVEENPIEPENTEESVELDYDSILLDHDYRLLCLETGLTE